MGFYEYEEEIENDFLEDDVIQYNKKGAPRKRKPKEPREYFTDDTEKAIIEYVASEDQVKRNKIYSQRIQYSFYKLAENIIHTFKFYYTDSDTIEDLKHEVVTFLLEKLHLFNHSKNINDKLRKIITKEFNEPYIANFCEYTGNAPTVTQEQINTFISQLGVSEKCFEQISQISPPKAYSYFGTIAKRYLIVYNDNNYKKIQDHIEIDRDESQEYEDKIEGNNEEYEKFMEKYISHVDSNLNKLFPKKADANVANAIIELFKKKDSLELFEKKALYVYIREITDTSTPHITKIIKRLDHIRKQLYNRYYENDYFL